MGLLAQTTLFGIDIEIMKFWAAGGVGALAAAIAFCQMLVARGQAKISARQVEILKGQMGIAKQQADTASRKINMDLFERRYKIYDATEHYVARLMNNPVLDDDRRFQIDTKEAKFLFDQELVDFLAQLVRLSSRLRASSGRY